MAGAASGGLIGYHSNRPAITLSHFRDAPQSLHRWLDGSLEELSSTPVHARGRRKTLLMGVSMRGIMISRTWLAKKRAHSAGLQEAAKPSKRP